MQFGEFEIFVVRDGTFRLDGGAMFGVVPKVLWSKLNEPDELNRIVLGLNCLLIKSSHEIILVDTGIGNHHGEKFASMYGISKSSTLLGSLADVGVKPDDVTKVVLTHLHFDHCSGNCRRSETGQFVPTFPGATYIMQQGELQYAKQPDPRSRGSYLSQNWEALEAAGQIQLIAGEQEIVPGVQVQVTGGHTLNHQIVKIHSRGKTACFLADLVPTDSHLKIPYVMGYDLYPKVTMEKKEQVLQQALQENWLLIFEHAPKITAGYLYEVDGKLAVERVDI